MNLKLQQILSNISSKFSQLAVCTHRAQMRILLYIGIHIGLNADIATQGYLATQPGGCLEVYIEETRIAENEWQIRRALR